MADFQERKRVRRFSISVCRERISPITQVCSVMLYSGCGLSGFDLVSVFSSSSVLFPAGLHLSYKHVLVSIAIIEMFVFFWLETVLSLLLALLCHNCRFR